MKIFITFAILLNLIYAQPREALLIGNSDYKYITDLDDPSSHLNRLKSSLKALDFKVVIKSNLNSEYLEESIDEFSRRLSKDRDTIGFLYYSGHGCQLDHKGYLIPTDVDTQKRLKIKHHALSINEMLETIDSANNRVNMLFLDACRDVPTGARGGTKGLGQLHTPKGTLVVYATEAGKIARDNQNFINALIKNINRPNQSIRNIGFNISNDVADQTQDSQIPVVFAKRLPNVVINEEDIDKPVEQITNHKNIITIDNLMWQDEPYTKADKQHYDKDTEGGRVWHHKGAKEYCSSLTLGGYEDWRLPTKDELISLLTKSSSKNSKGYSYYIKKEFLENMPPLNGEYSNAVFFTSTSKDSSSFWVVGFGYGSGVWNDDSHSGYVRCVRQ